MSALYVAWRAGGPNSGSWRPIGKLDFADGVYRFVYTRGAATPPAFRPLAGMPDLHAVYESERLFPTFANRLLPKSRPEYADFLRWGGFDGAPAPDPLAVLAVTEGIRQTDALELFPAPQPDVSGCYEARFFLHGLRHQTPAARARAEQLHPGEVLIPRAEPDNAHDPLAVAVGVGDGDAWLRLGYVPRYLARDSRRLLDDCCDGTLTLAVARVNPEAPAQQRVLCQLNACWPADFQPFADEAFQPLDARATVS